MPRLKQTPLEGFHIELVATIRKRLIILDMRPTELAKFLGINASTIYAKLKRPQTFTLDELYFICKKLGLSFVIAERNEGRIEA